MQCRFCGIDRQLPSTLLIKRDGRRDGNVTRMAQEIRMVISFGDAVNDLPMFEASDECYAVANAVDELKAAATGIIESNVDDGVAKWLLEHVELR